MYFTYSYQVNSREVDWKDQARPSAVLGYLQEAATSAAEALHVSRNEMAEKYNAFWMLARVWYRLDRPLAYHEQLTIHTWHRGGHGASMYRDFDLFVGDEQVGEAVSVWVLADLDTHKLLRFNKVEECQDETAGGELCKTMQLSGIKLPEGMGHAGDRRFYYSDTDINGHVNNVHYADFTCDALEMETLGEGRFVSSLQVAYLAECRAGERVHMEVGQTEGVYYVNGIDDSGKSRFRAALTLRDM